MVGQLHNVRVEIAIVRALLDEVERVNSEPMKQIVAEQLKGELTRLGHQILDIANEMTDRPDTSGVHLRPLARTA